MAPASRRWRNRPAALLAGLRGVDLPLAGRGTGPDRHRTGLRGTDRSAGHRLLAGAGGPRQHPHADGLGRFAERGGFTTGTPWLPVKPPQLARNVAGQTGGRDRCWKSTARCWPFAAARRRCVGRHAVPGLPEPLLAFLRGLGEGALLCLFNLSPASGQAARAAASIPWRAVVTYSVDSPGPPKAGHEECGAPTGTARRKRPSGP
jgi:hypothetical protein